MPHRALLPLALLAACSTAGYRQEADDQVYDILDKAAQRVVGGPRELGIERPDTTLRRTIEANPDSESIELDLPHALDVAAENSRDFQRQREALYLTALSLTRALHDFEWRFGGGLTDTVQGTGDDSSSLGLAHDLQASRNTESGGRVVASFVNSFLKDLVHGGSFNGSSILGLSFTQPLLRGAGRRIAREPLTQAERNVIYAMRDFERFRATFSVRVVSQYYRLLQQIENLTSEEENVKGTVRNRQRVEALVVAGRLAGVDLDRAQQQEYDASDRLNVARSTLQTSLDSFKLLLGLPTDAPIELDQAELDKLKKLDIEKIDLSEDRAIALGLARRYDYRTAVDEVEDAARGIDVAEDALRSMLDFSSSISVPTERGKPLRFDWASVDWSAGFDLELALDRLPERNAYRTSLINLDVAIRNREQAADNVKADVREALRSIERTFNSYRINRDALALSERRLERADDFLQAGRGDTLALLDAQRDLLSSRLALTRAIADYAIARLELLRDLEGLVFGEKGLRYDPTLPLPQGPLEPYGASHGVSAPSGPAPAPGKGT